LLPVVGRFVDTNHDKERVFIGSDRDEMESFLKELHTSPDKKPFLQSPLALVSWVLKNI
jgi:hypothetical protein